MGHGVLTVFVGGCGSCGAFGVAMSSPTHPCRMASVALASTNFAFPHLVSISSRLSCVSTITRRYAGPAAARNGASRCGAVVRCLVFVIGLLWFLRRALAQRLTATSSHGSKHCVQTYQWVSPRPATCSGARQHAEPDVGANREPPRRADLQFCFDIMASMASCRDALASVHRVRVPHRGRVQSSRRRVLSASVRLVDVQLHAQSRQMPNKALNDNAAQFPARRCLWVDRECRVS